MTMNEAIATLPAWVGIWLKILMLGAFILPLGLLIWRGTRMTAIWVLLAGVASAVGVGFMYSQMGYVKLLGLPHILFYTPLALHLWLRLNGEPMHKIARGIVMFTLAVIVISLVFDYTDAIRYILGNRTPLAGTI